MKNFLSILLSLALILGVAVFETIYLDRQFEEFGEVLETLYEKTELGIVNEEDEKAVQAVWEEKKTTLHILIPHTAMASIDAWLSEAKGYLHQGNLQEVLPKIEVLLNLCETIPASYKPFLQNIL